MTTEEELALYKTAFELATQCGTTEHYEGWGGPRRRTLGPEASREKFLRMASKRIEEACAGLV